MCFLKDLMMMEFIALKLKKVRLNRGISQEDLAYVCGLNRNN